jgi:bifunctional DNA primase/polymerase-like protein/primase-like protein
MSELLDAALAYAAAGLWVFPCRPAAKSPATPHGCQDATVDPEQINRWWRANPDFNVAVATGETSQLFIADVDGLDGAAELRKLEAEHGELPPTWDVLTPNHGRHVGFAWPGCPVRNSASKLAPNIDIRGQGGYVLVPPSRLARGIYAWSVDCADEIAEAPPWLIDRVAGPQAVAPMPPADWCDLIDAGVAEGARDTTVTRLAGYLLAQRVDALVTLELLRAWNAARCRPPLPDKDIERIVGSIAARELQRRSRA